MPEVKPKVEEKPVDKKAEALKVLADEENAHLVEMAGKIAAILNNEYVLEVQHTIVFKKIK